MAWIRLSDDYNDHPKFTHLSDGAFRLWHQAIGFCRKFQTDGFVDDATVRDFKAFTARRMTELLTPWRSGERPLWDRNPDGIHVHDYLDWNTSKEELADQREDAKERMRAKRLGQKSPPRSENVRANIIRTSSERSRDVLGGVGYGSSSLEKESEEKPSVERALAVVADSDALDLRAGHLVERYAELFYLHRHGARYHSRIHLDFMKAQELVHTWPDDARLEKLAVLVLTTDDDWISRTDRGFGIFAARATWADDKLKAWEIENGIAV